MNLPLDEIVYAGFFLGRKMVLQAPVVDFMFEKPLFSQN